MCFLLLRLEWLHFKNMKTNRHHIGNPQVSKGWDRGYFVDTECTINNSRDMSPGEHTICDINGNSLKLNDVKTGMLVKIRAKMFIILAMSIFTQPMGYGVSVLQHETYTFNSNISVYSYKLKKIIEQDPFGTTNFGNLGQQHTTSKHGKSR